MLDRGRPCIHSEGGPGFHSYNTRTPRTGRIPGVHGYLHSCCLLTAGIVGWSSRWTFAGAGTVVWWRLGGIRRRMRRLKDMELMAKNCGRRTTVVAEDMTLLNDDETVAPLDSWLAVLEGWQR